MRELFLTVVDRINRLLKVIVIICLVISLVAITCQVLFRYIFHQPLSWTEELSRYLMIWITFLGASLAVRYQRLIKLEIIYMLISDRGKKWVLILAGFLSCFFYAILIVFGYLILDTVVMQHSPALHISMAIPYAAIPVGGILMLVNTIASLIDPFPKTDQGVDPL
ncbi:MAG: TRAP transporter small permease [Bacillota bacterium]|nr:TRAP transporter small permease [Bacillota bacterium]